MRPIRHVFPIPCTTACGKKQKTVAEGRSQTDNAKHGWFPTPSLALGYCHEGFLPTAVSSDRDSGSSTAWLAFCFLASPPSAAGRCVHGPGGADAFRP